MSHSLLPLCTKFCDTMMNQRRSLEKDYSDFSTDALIREASKNAIKSIAVENCTVVYRTIQRFWLFSELKLNYAWWHYTLFMHCLHSVTRQTMMNLCCVLHWTNLSSHKKKSDKTIKVKTKTKTKQKVGKPHTINSAFYTCNIYK